MTRNGSKIIISRSVLAMMTAMAVTVALAWLSTESGQAQPPDQAKHAYQHEAAAKADDILIAKSSSLGALSPARRLAKVSAFLGVRISPNCTDCPECPAASRLTNTP